MGSTSLKKEFWDRVDDTRIGMLATDTSRAIPMSHYADHDANCLWFITARDTDLAKSAQTGAAAEYLVTSKDEHLYARIDRGETSRTGKKKEAENERPPGKT